MRVMAIQVMCWVATLSLLACSSPLIKPEATSSARSSVLSLAGAQVGVPYRFDGADRHGFDSSGLIYFSYTQAGFKIPRDIEGQLRAAKVIPFYEVKPADLLFYRLAPGQSGTQDGLHVGLYVGEGQMVHAPLNRDQVVLESIDSPYWLQRFVHAARLLP